MPMQRSITEINAVHHNFYSGLWLIYYFFVNIYIFLVQEFNYFNCSYNLWYFYDLYAVSTSCRMSNCRVNFKHYLQRRLIWFYCVLIIFLTKFFINISICGNIVFIYCSDILSTLKNILWIGTSRYSKYFIFW